MDRASPGPLLALGTLVLLAVGLAVLYSAGQTDVPTLAATVWKRQLVWIGIGIVVAAFSYNLTPRFLEGVAPVVYVGAALLLLLTLLVGTGAGTAASSKSWLSIAGVRIGQPAELAKIGSILGLAYWLGGRRQPPGSLWELAPAVGIIGIPFLLVGLQPDLGSALVFVGILFSMLFWSGVSPWLLLFLASPVISLLMAFSNAAWAVWIVLLTIILLVVRPFLAEAFTIWGTNVLMGVVALELWGRLAGYQQARLMSFINPDFDPQASGWHLIQSKVAIGSGGIVGKGFTLGTQKRLAFLPEQHTDFIFPVVGEEFGFLGVLVAILLFSFLLVQLMRISARANDAFSSLVVFGFAGMLFTHIVENVGMTVGLMPITGIPLPFFSYGGSFLLVCFLCIGYTLRVASEGRTSGYGD